MLYWKVLQWAGTQEEKIAHLELALERTAITTCSARSTRRSTAASWEDVHKRPADGGAARGPTGAALLSNGVPAAGAFSKMRFSLALDARAQAVQVLELVRRKSGHQNVLFLIDEARQYVAPQGELILNLDGLARNLKELGQGPGVDCGNGAADADGDRGAGDL